MAFSIECISKVLSALRFCTVFCCATASFYLLDVVSMPSPCSLSVLIWCQWPCPPLFSVSRKGVKAIAIFLLAHMTIMIAILCYGFFCRFFFYSFFLLLFFYTCSFSLLWPKCLKWEEEEILNKKSVYKYTNTYYTWISEKAELKADLNQSICCQLYSCVCESLGLVCVCSVCVCVLLVWILSSLIRDLLHISQG